MTVIAWDGTTLAADRQAVTAGRVYSVTKIHRLEDGRLVGVSGHFGRGMETLDWLRRSGPLDEFPKGTEDEWCYVLVVHPHGRVERYEGRGTPLVVEDMCHSIGSGADYATAAMFLGRSAEEAVAITCELSAECGNGIDTLRFEP